MDYAGCNLVIYNPYVDPNLRNSVSNHLLRGYVDP